MSGAQYRFNYKGEISSQVGNRYVGPNCGFAASPEVSPGATVGTLQTGYPYVQASRQDKEQGMHRRVATCPTALDPASPPRWAPALPHALQLWTLPPYRGGLWCCHVPYGSKAHLAAEAGFGAATCPVAPNLAILLRWAPALPHVQWLRTSPPYQGALQRCYASNGFGPHLPAEVGSRAVACPMTPDPASWLGRVSVLPRVPWFPVGRGPQIYKGLASLAMRLGTHVPKARPHVFEAPDT
jgi:hypothetical protein